MKKYKKLIIYTLIIITYIIFVIVLSPRKMQNDTFWSIKVGERIVNEGIFGIDNFSIHEDLYYIAHHFLTDVLIYGVHSIAGFDGLYILEVILALIIAGLFYLLNKEICGSKAVSCVMLVLQMFIMSMFIAVRAQMISFILFLIEMLLLEKYKKDSKKRYLVGLGIIPILLANFHMGTVPFYFIILGVYGISLIKLPIPFLQGIDKTDKKRLKELIIIGLIGLVTIFINPYFVDGVIYPFKTFGNTFINSNIAEFQPYSITIDRGYSLIYILVIVLTLIIAKKKMKIEDFLLIFGTLFMAFMTVRYVSLLIICSAVSVRYMSDLKDVLKFKTEELKALKGTCIVLGGLVLLTLVSNYMLNSTKQYIDVTTYPVKAVEFLKENITEEDKIFNSYSWGSYLMLNNIKVFIDSRCDLYTKEYNGTEIANDYEKMEKCDISYKDIIEKYNINIFVIPIDVSLETLLEENVEFQRIYKDDVAVIYKRVIE